MLERKLFDQPTPLNLTVTGRLKEKYSLWRKMERKRIEERRNIDLDDIHDVVAMRIIINLEREADEPESEWKGVSNGKKGMSILCVSGHPWLSPVIPPSLQRGLYLCYRIMYLCLRFLSAPGYKTLVEDYVSAPKPVSSLLSHPSSPSHVQPCV